ncbi:MAG TPA: hypothetical protein VE621_09685 [Bryobacteraceae bacterium]|jgi:hypothetical protein|nr:hypothetical protein [Bryobacteraceae bacterium]
MHDPGTSGRSARLARRHFLTADLEIGFALLRAAAKSRTLANRAFELRQIEEARLALQRARTLHADMHEEDAGKFNARIDELERAIEAATKPARNGIARGT